MSEQAKITSLDAVEDFRARLVIYLSKARPALDETSSEIRKLKHWVENEQMLRWDRELKRRHRAVDEAQQALLSARISNLNKDATAALQMDLSKAKRAYDAAEAKVRLVKKWSRDFDHQIEPRLRQMEKLNTVLCHDVPKAIFFLSRVVKILAEYADRGAPQGAEIPYPSLKAEVPPEAPEAPAEESSPRPGPEGEKNPGQDETTDAAPASNPSVNTDPTPKLS